MATFTGGQTKIQLNRGQALVSTAGTQSLYKCADSRFHHTVLPLKQFCSRVSPLHKMRPVYSSYSSSLHHIPPTHLVFIFSSTNSFFSPFLPLIFILLYSFSFSAFLQLIFSSPYFSSSSFIHHISPSHLFLVFSSSHSS